MAQILLASFEPFGGLEYNPSQDVVEEFCRQACAGELTTQAEYGDVAIQTATLPVEFGVARRALQEALQRYHPDVAIAVGLASGISTIRLERLGVNLRDARIRDNAGAQPVDEPVINGGPEAYFSTLRLKAARHRIATAGIPVSLSLSAGTFLCNEALYTLLHSTEPPSRAGFIHVPDIQDPESPVTLDQSATALDFLVCESLVKAEDLVSAGGTLH